jgi:hypothetical protein
MVSVKEISSEKGGDMRELKKYVHFKSFMGIQNEKL